MPFFRLLALFITLTLVTGAVVRAESEDESVEALEAELNAMPEAEAKGENLELPLPDTGTPVEEVAASADQLEPLAEEEVDLEKSLASEESNWEKDTKNPPPVQKAYSAEEFRNMSRQEILNYHRDLIHGNMSPEAEILQTVAAPLTHKYLVNIGGVVLGESEGNSVWPTLQYHSALSKHYTMGIVGSFTAFTFDELEVLAYSGTATMTYYPQDTYRGVFGKVGLGFGKYYYRSAGNIDYARETVSLNGLATLGYRWTLGEAFSLGFEGGVYYYYLPGVPGEIFSRTGSITASVVLPVVFLDMGFAF